MIFVASQRGGAKQLGLHLLKAEENGRSRILAGRSPPPSKSAASSSRAATGAGSWRSIASPPRPRSNDT